MSEAATKRYESHEEILDPINIRNDNIYKAYFYVKNLLCNEWYGEHVDFEELL